MAPSEVAAQGFLPACGMREILGVPRVGLLVKAGGRLCCLFS